jgi:hypothetical protein
MPVPWTASRIHPAFTLVKCGLVPVLIITSNKVFPSGLLYSKAMVVMCYLI